jgi:uncharacterized protein (DUF58 family)
MTPTPPQEERVPTIFAVTLVQIFAVVFLFIALLNGRRDLTVLTLLIIGMGTGARLWSRLSLSGIKWSVSVDKRKVFPDEDLGLDIGAENTKFLPIWLQMEVPAGGLLHPSQRQTTVTKESGLLWYQRVRFRWDLTAQRRGVYRIGPPHAKVGDFFGFFLRDKILRESLEVIVYPRIVPLASFCLTRRDFFGASGAKSPVQDPVYILGTRDYQHWRPARYIHWKASARHNRLQEKVCEPTEREKVLLAVDVDQFHRNNAEEDFERTLEIVASLAVRLDEEGCAVGLVTNGIVRDGPAVVPIARNQRQLPAILEVLARLQMQPAGDLTGIAHRALGLLWGVSCVYFSYQKDQTSHAAGHYFSFRKIPVVFIVCRADELSDEDGHTSLSPTYRLENMGSKGAERA